MLLFEKQNSNKQTIHFLTEAWNGKISIVETSKHNRQLELNPAPS